MPPGWLTGLGWSTIAVAFACSAGIAADVWVRGHRQHMKIMEFVWPITALYFGGAAVYGYFRFGLPSSPQWQAETGRAHAQAQPAWSHIAVSVTHCGAGCALGDVMSEWILFVMGATIAGLALVPEYIGDYTAALALGIVFQYFVIAPMRGLGLRQGLIEAANADFLSITFFEIGLFGWMALMTFVFFAHEKVGANQPAFWLMMQVGMILGFVTSWPVNVWLIRRGIKEAM